MTLYDPVQRLECGVVPHAGEGDGAHVARFGGGAFGVRLAAIDVRGEGLHGGGPAPVGEVDHRASNGGTLAAPSSVMAVSALAVRGHSFTIRRRRLLAASRCPASRYAETRRQAVAEICAAGRLAATAAASAASRTLTVLARSPEFQ